MTAEQPPLTADPDVIRTWLTHLYAGCPGFVSICSDADGWAGRRFATDEAGLAAATKYAVGIDGRKPQGIYAQVTTLREHPPIGPDGKQGRGGEDLAHGLTYLWADGDFGTIGHKPGPDDLAAPPDADAVVKVVAESPMPDPSGWTNSGGGYNPAWLLAEAHIIGDEDDRARAKELTMGVQAILAAQAYQYGWSWDSEVGNLDRLMKLPGTVNRKEGLERPTSIGPGDGTVYDIRDVAALVAEHAPAAREILEQAAREKQERKRQRLGLPAPAPRRPRPAGWQQPTGDGPLDILAATLRFADVLEPHGFTYEGTHSDGRERWKRPTVGGDSSSSAYSLLCDDHVAVNWSERSDLPVGAQPAGRKLTIGNLWAHLNYGGDVSEAASDILRAAAGRDSRGAAGSLPGTVLDEVRRRCIREDVKPPRLEEGVNWDDLSEPPDEPDESAGPAKPSGLLPEEFYARREELRHIRQAGHSRNRSGDVAVLATLTRLSALVSHYIRADTGVAGHASLNLFGGLIGPSGIGKSTGVEVAELLLPTPQGLDFRDGLPIGSGEGMAEVFIDVVEEETGEVNSRGKAITHRVRRQVRHNAFFYVDEGASLTRLMKERSGSTLGEALRSAAVGQTLGQTNASKETSRYIPKGSYSMGVLVGFQPETVAPLFEEVGEGTPQRFLWLQVIDPSIPDEQPPWPGELLAWRTAVDVEAPTLISFDEEIRTELRRADLAKARGEIPVAELNPLDSHAPLMRVKVASLLAVLTGRLHVTGDDWQLADMVWQASCATRDAVLEDIERQWREEQEKRTQARIFEEVRVEQAKISAENERSDKAVLRIATRIAHYVQGGELNTRKALRARFSGRDKKHINDAIAYAELREWVTDRDGRLAAGPIAPE
ncbi:hypothetical protein EJ357_22700 [Streptomyces cyaneochromogenes]|uniref:DUF3987 domain-containing protein n=1 Tax=Streptomyces cyaneochromogenes TaxID=2496836 RepID=A0A3S9MA17_9ACTN|nr:hypothetical protein [Streptomyces cyaneochromogenes]AZQ35943.1 hypothetical protein EJ357_22700 [Streptomyces cyaneochromogenes]